MENSENEIAWKKDILSLFLEYVHPCASENLDLKKNLN